MSALALASSRFTVAEEYSPDKLGVQLYVFRAMLAKDFDGTLAQVAAIGIKNVEFAGFYGRTAAQVRASLSNAGLTASGAHCLLASMSDDEINRMIDFCHQVGMPYMIAAIPSIKPSAGPAPGKPSGNPFEHIELEDWRWSAERFNVIGARVRDAGMRFAYHNHNIEAQKYGNIVAFDELLRLTDPKVVGIEFDTGNFIAGGGDPYPYLAKYPQPIRTRPRKRMGQRIYPDLDKQLPEIRTIRPGHYRLEKDAHCAQASRRERSLHRAGRHCSRRRIRSSPPGIPISVEGLKPTCCYLKCAATKLCHSGRRSPRRPKWRNLQLLSARAITPLTPQIQHPIIHTRPQARP